MLHTSPKQDLARASVETATHVAAANLSCAQTRDHVVASREAIQHSLRLLSRTAYPWGDGDGFRTP
jgi:hypothetical protein